MREVPPVLRGFARALAVAARQTPSAARGLGRLSTSATRCDRTRGGQLCARSSFPRCSNAGTGGSFFFFFVRVQCVDVISIVLKHGDFQAQAAETEQPRDRVSQRAFDGAKLAEARLTKGPGR